MDTQDDAAARAELGGLLACPHCAAAGALGPGAWVCEQGHSFDVARSGYLNLLPATRRRSSGDPVEALKARRRVLDRGYYAALADVLSRFVTPVGEGPAAFADFGCGEGWLVRRLQKSAGQPSLGIGIDMSKRGIDLAARSAGPRALFLVANTFQPPLRPASLDCGLCVLAPLRPEVVRRTVRPGGTLVTVTPGPAHLKEFRDILHADHRRDPRFDKRVEKQATAQHSVRASFAMHGPEEIADLVDMTPYGLSPDLRGRLLDELGGRAGVEVTTEFSVFVEAVTA